MAQLGFSSCQAGYGCPSLDDTILGKRILCTDEGIIDKLTAHVNGDKIFGSFTVYFKYAIYDDDENLIAQTEEGTQSGSGVPNCPGTWESLDFDPCVRVRKGKYYWLCAWGDKNDGDEIYYSSCRRMQHLVGAGKKAIAYTGTYPDPIVWDSQNATSYIIYDVYDALLNTRRGHAVWTP